MRWEGRRESGNVEDRRRMRSGPVMIGGGLGTLVLLLLVAFLGGDPIQLLQQLPQQQLQAPPQGEPANDEVKRFVSVVLADTEDVWNELFRRMGRRYREPKLILFTEQVRSACGMAGAAVGPFYCPADECIYIDLGFFEELDRRFGAPGDFAQAYVLAHEVGHHVQKQLGWTDKVDSLRGRARQAEQNQMSVRLELQADFLAGVWAHHAQRMKNILESGDVEEGLRAASAIGDDRLQRQSQGYVVPDAFTHGTSEQRVRWFTRGLKTGDITQGDTFSARQL